MLIMDDQIQIKVMIGKDHCIMTCCCLTEFEDEERWVHPYRGAQLKRLNYLYKMLLVNS